MAHSADRWAEDPRKHMSHHAQLSMVKWLRDAMELKGTKREILSAMHVKELIQSNHSER